MSFSNDPLPNPQPYDHRGGEWGYGALQTVRNNVEAMQITLQWPPSQLSPNRASRLHWAAKMKYKQSYRDACFYDTKAQAVGGFMEQGNIPVEILFHPPRNAGDLDNYLAAAKAGLDGMCDALKINDKRLRPMTLDVGEKYAGGKIVITFLEKKNA